MTGVQTCALPIYPSGEPHIGHLKNYALGDAIAHFHRRIGQRVLHPMGYDAFGLPAENNAIKTGVHPRKATEDSIASFQRQFRSWGVSIDVNGNVAGIELVNGTDAESSFRVLADHFQVAIPGADPLPVFTTGLVGGTQTVGINGNLILTGTITASMMNIGTLSAISANLGAVTAGTLSDPNHARMLIDLNNGFLDIFDNS